MAVTVGGIKAGNAFVVIGALDDTGKALAKIGRRIQSWGRTMSSIGMDMVFRGVLATAPIVATMRKFQDFDDAMRRVQGRTGATDRQIEQLSQTALKAGKDIGVLPTAIANIFDELAQKDFSLEEMNALAPQIALLGKSTGAGRPEDMMLAAKLMSTSIQAFKIPVSEAADIVDILTVAANKSNFSLEDLTTTLGTIGPTARMMGMDLTTTLAVLAQMRNVEMQAETAGIALRNILLNMTNQKDVAKFNEMLQNVGETSLEFLDKAGNLKDGAQLIFEVFAKLKNVGTGVRAQMLETLFGKRAITGSIAVGASKEKFDSLMEAFANRNGVAGSTAKAMEAGFGGAMRKIAGAVERLAIQLGGILDPALRLVGNGVEFIIDKIMVWANANPNLVRSIALTTFAVVGIGASLFVMAIAVKAAGLVLEVFGTIWSFVQKTLAAGLAIIDFTIDTFLALTKCLYSLATGAVSMLVNSFSMLWSIASGLVSTVTVIINTVQMITTAISILSAFGMLTPVLIAIAGAFIVVGGAIILVYGGLKKLWGAFMEFASIVTSGLGSAFENLFAGFGAGLDRIFNTIKLSGIVAFATLQNAFTTAFDLAKLNKFEEAWDVLKTGMIAAAVEIGYTFKDVMLNSFDKISDRLQMFMLEIIQVGEKIALLGQLKLRMASQQEQDMAMGALDMAQAAGRGAFAGKLDAASNKAAQERKRGSDKAKREAMAEFEAAWAKGQQILAEQPLGEGLGDKLPEIPQELPPNGTNLMGSGDRGLPKALEGLEKGSIEAAKKAWENALNQETEGGLPALQLSVSREIATNTGKMANALGVV